MRFTGLALAAGALVIGACGGEKPPAGGETATTTPPPVVAQTATYMPPTGKVWEVRMTGAGEIFKFEPAALTIKAGDAIKFIAISGFPHNIAFQPDSIPDDVEPQLGANMQNSTAPMMGPFLLAANDAYIISFAGVKPGKYPFNCTPHLMFNMKGVVTVE